MKTRPCQRCTQTIPPERVEALPETRLCVNCSKNVGGEFQHSFKEESLGKTGSLKKNYGGIEVTKTRKKIEPINNCTHENSSYYGDTYPVTYKCNDCGAFFTPRN